MNHRFCHAFDSSLQFFGFFFPHFFSQCQWSCCLSNIICERSWYVFFGKAFVWKCYCSFSIENLWRTIDRFVVCFPFCFICYALYALGEQRKRFLFLFFIFGFDCRFLFLQLLSLSLVGPSVLMYTFADTLFWSASIYAILYIFYVAVSLHFSRLSRALVAFLVSLMEKFPTRTQYMDSFQFWTCDTQTFSS